MATERDGSGDVTRLLEDWSGGDEHALEELLPIVYDELRELAQIYMWAERGDHTLQPTALVHEAFLRLIKGSPGQVENRTHFFAVAAKAMRRVLIEHARRHQAAKRPSSRERVALQDVAGTLEFDSANPMDVLALDSALERLGAIDPRSAQVVELRYFGGLTLVETAEVLGVSLPTVTRDWHAARIWLRRTLDTGRD